MAEVSSDSQNDDTILVSATHLGKRKRTLSPDLSRSPVKAKDSSLQTSLQEVLRILRKHDSTPSLLRYPLPSAVETHDSKRARLANSETAIDTIESRILGGAYSSFRELSEDLNNVKDTILKDLSQSSTNGDTKSASPSTPDVQSGLANIMKMIAALDTEVSKGSRTDAVNAGREDIAEASLPDYQSRHILSLRGQVNGSTKLLYSGVEAGQPAEEDDIEETLETEGMNLPNGFELTDFAALGGDGKKQSQEKRLFGDVFAPPSRLKPLELPRPSKNTVRGNTLEFVPYWSQIDSNPQFKHDYRFTKLPVGSWIKYGASGASADQTRKRSRQLSTTNDYRAALEANDVQQKTNMSADALFSSAYSSFAPRYDNSASIFSERDRGRFWWFKYGEQKLSKVLPTEESEVPAEDTGTREEILDNFEEVVASFEREPETDPFRAQDEPETVDDLLEEVSGLIETLASLQKIRSLDPIVTGSLPKPSEPEVDIYEMLRTQLRILISTLPPFAVAKLNGDQLESLNISTNIIVEPPDYPGTGQVDIHTFQRQKLSQQATSAASRTTATPQLRPNYAQAPVTTGAYNSQVRNYNSVPATAGYGMRAPYQTPTLPRPSYTQAPYQTSGTGYGSRPTIQQFQRQVQNGYGSYGGTPAQTPGYVQRPVQPVYPARAQDNAMTNVARSASPQKPIVNGQHYQPRPHPSQQVQTPYPYQRQGSGTPGTPSIVPQAGAAYGGYNAAAPQAVRAAPGGATPQIPQAQSAAQTPAQTAEVSR